jgi:hypothetical protein
MRFGRISEFLKKFFEDYLKVGILGENFTTLAVIKLKGERKNEPHS